MSLDLNRAHEQRNGRHERMFLDEYVRCSFHSLHNQPLSLCALLTILLDDEVREFQAQQWAVDQM